MAWTNPTTQVTGTLMTASTWNTDLVDNMTFLGAFTAGGVALSAATQGTAIEDLMHPAARAYRTTDQALTSGTPDDIEFDAEHYDYGGLHDAGTNTERLTAQIAGIYDIRGEVHIEANATGQRRLDIIHNGTAIIASVSQTPIAGGRTRMGLSTVWALAANDYVTLQAQQDSGGPLDVLADGTATPWFAMSRIRGGG